MTITILTDNSDSWFLPYGNLLYDNIASMGHNVTYVFRKEDIEKGDICFLLSCVKLVDQRYLDLNRHNIVVHASDLPQGKGFSPLQWQILEGRHEIVITLFEVVEKVDSGPYYYKSKIAFDGNELYDELRSKLGCKIVDMCLNFVRDCNTTESIPQRGEETFYPRRKDTDDEIDVNQSIAQLFNHFRIADNEKHPLYFRYKGYTYILKIYKKV